MERRKRRKAFDVPGHAHEFTFCCYRGLNLFEDDATKDIFVKCLDEARAKQGFKIWAYVVMPEHVHLLLHPGDFFCKVSEMLSSVKSESAKQGFARLQEIKSPLLERVRVKRKDATSRRRFWQAGGGFDRNMFSPKIIRASIDYLHMNPVRRGLCESTVDWRWSSARWYEGLDALIEIDPPACGL